MSAFPGNHVFADGPCSKLKRSHLTGPLGVGREPTLLFPSATLGKIPKMPAILGLDGLSLPGLSRALRVFSEIQALEELRWKRGRVLDACLRRSTKVSKGAVWSVELLAGDTGRGTVRPPLYFFVSRPLPARLSATILPSTSACPLTHWRCVVRPDLYANLCARRTISLLVLGLHLPVIMFMDQELSEKMVTCW